MPIQYRRYTNKDKYLKLKNNDYVLKILTDLIKKYLDFKIYTQDLTTNIILGNRNFVVAKLENKQDYFLIKSAYHKTIEYDELKIFYRELLEPDELILKLDTFLSDIISLDIPDYLIN